MRVCGEMCRYIYRVYMYVSEVEIVFIVSCCAGGPGSTWNQRRHRRLFIFAHCSRNFSSELLCVIYMQICAMYLLILLG